MPKETVSQSSERYLDNELRLVMRSQQSGNLEDAKNRTDSLVIRFHNHPGARMAKGMILLYEGKYEESLEWLQASLKVDPQNPEALAWAATVAIKLKKVS